MPLLTCPDCGREVSDRASACPGCGAPMAAATAPASRPEPVMVNEPTLTRNRGCADLLLILVVVIVIALIYSIS